MTHNISYLFVMGYRNMKKIAFILIFCTISSAACFAQNNAQAMKLITINTLMQYGEKLYERGDYNEASAVFNHVLTYDGQQAQALKYLKEMGRLPASYILGKVDAADTNDLQAAIEAKRQSIEKLQFQIMQLRANIATLSANN
jgi:hypothetical protein